MQDRAPRESAGAPAAPTPALANVSPLRREFSHGGVDISHVLVDCAGEALERGEGDGAARGAEEVGGGQWAVGGEGQAVQAGGEGDEGDVVSPGQGGGAGEAVEAQAREAQE